jgi:hypothetical protein
LESQLGWEILEGSGLLRNAFGASRKTIASLIYLKRKYGVVEPFGSGARLDFDTLQFLTCTATVGTSFWHSVMIGRFVLDC